MLSSAVLTPCAHAPQIGELHDATESVQDARSPCSIHTTLSSDGVSSMSPTSPARATAISSVTVTSTASTGVSAAPQPSNNEEERMASSARAPAAGSPRAQRRSFLNVSMNDLEARGPDVRATVLSNAASLDSVVGRFVDLLIAHIDSVPYGIRWLCKTIRRLLLRTFPQCGDDDVATLIGGFFMLRYVNPAVVTPYTVMRVEGTISARTKRNLTLVRWALRVARCASQAFL